MNRHPKHHRLTRSVLDFIIAWDCKERGVRLATFNLLQPYNMSPTGTRSFRQHCQTEVSREPSLIARAERRLSVGHPGDARACHLHAFNGASSQVFRMGLPRNIRKRFSETRKSHPKFRGRRENRSMGNIVWTQEYCAKPRDRVDQIRNRKGCAIWPFEAPIDAHPAGCIPIDLTAKRRCRRASVRASTGALFDLLRRERSISHGNYLHRRPRTRD